MLFFSRNISLSKQFRYVLTDLYEYHRHTCSKKAALRIKPNITILRILNSLGHVQTSMTVNITVEHFFFCGLRKQSILTAKQTSRCYHAVHFTLTWLYTHRKILLKIEMFRA